VTSLMSVYRQSMKINRPFQASVKDALLVVLTSPQFLFLIENSQTPTAEDLAEYELASKLSFFLWNSPPDKRLLALAAQNKLRESLDSEVDRLIADPRFDRFARQFASQWLSLDKFDVVKTDTRKFSSLTRDTKTALRREPVETLKYLIRQNLPTKNLVQSDFIMANEPVAKYYGLADKTESGFAFVPIKHGTKHLGGLLTQASILAGLSDGRESNPVKRGAWVARKIVAEPPDDPPPNVPQIMEDNKELTLRQKLELHRNQKGCANCHSGIDPWGLPFEEYSAGGLLKQGRKKQGQKTDTPSNLPDNTSVNNVNELKSYLAGKRIDRVAFSVLKHLGSYATGRTLTYNEIAFLEEHAVELKPTGYRLRDMVRFIVNSDLFLKK